jgi:GTP cyclohydrolase I
MIKEMKKEQYNAETTALLAENYKTIIHGLGEDVTREGLQKTPERVAKQCSSNTWIRIRPIRNTKGVLFTEDIAK